MFSFQVEMVKKVRFLYKNDTKYFLRKLFFLKVSTPAEAIQFLLELERINRNSLKRVVLDCPESVAKQILRDHVGNIKLGRRNFHYLLSGLVLEDSWDEGVAEYGAINVTGLKLFNEHRGDASR